MSPAPPLARRLALVTGASRGIGLAVAGGLRGAGAHVVRLARSLPDEASEGETTLHCDVSDDRQVARALDRVARDHGVPDVIVHSAGAFVLKPLAETTPDDFVDSLAVNLTGPFLVSRALVPRLVARGSGHVVTIGSVADRVAYPGNAAYAASKFGLRGMHEVIAAELAGTGVRTTLVSPGPVDTDMWAPVDPDARPGFTKRRDMLRPADVADAVLWAVTRPPNVDVTEIRVMPVGRSSF